MTQPSCRAARARSTEAGFSLVEMMVAMVVAVIVTGAVFALMTAGQGAFRREPELSDRQQNIRVAMDFIQRDLLAAGSGLATAPPYVQVFARAQNGVGPVGPTGNSDALEFLGTDSECPEVPINAPATGFPVVVTLADLRPCYPGPVHPVAVAFADNSTRWGFAGGVNDTSPDDTISFAIAQPPEATIDDVPLPAAPPARVAAMQIIRYQVLVDANTGIPDLWRSARGGRDDAGALQPPQNGVAGWQIVARGIEDLQVSYRMADGDIQPEPDDVAAGAPPFGAPATLVREVQVTLWARATAPLLQGQRQAAGVPDAVRASLVSVTTPRAVLVALRGAGVWQ